MFYSGSTNLKFSIKRNQWENGGNHNCTITVNENKDDYYRGYSYNEVIFYYDEKYKKWIFNDSKFSITTSSHQSGLWSRLLKIASENNIIKTRSYSINSGFNYEKLEQSYSNIELVKKYFPEKLEDFKAKLEQNEINRKKSISTNSMRKKLKALDYSTKKGFLSALEKCEMRLSNISLDNCYDTLKALSIGFTVNEVKNLFTLNSHKGISLRELVTISENSDLKEIYDLKELEKNNRIDFKMYIYEAPSNSDDFFKTLDKIGILEKVINKTFNEVDLDQYASGRALKEYLAKKSLTDITGA